MKLPLEIFKTENHILKYAIFDKNNILLGGFYDSIRKEDVEEIIKRVNEYDELKRRIENQKCSIISYEEELQKKNALIRELIKELKKQKDFLDRLECTCDEENGYICDRCSMITSICVEIKRYEKAEGVE